MVPPPHTHTIQFTCYSHQILDVFAQRRRMYSYGDTEKITGLFEMIKNALLVLFSALLLSLAAPAFADVVPVKVASTCRAGIEIPAFITVPDDYDPSAMTDLVIMIHGHGDDHNEFGGYDAISNGLAENGMLVVTLDLPGCGDSTESFRLNTLTNMKNDVVDVLNYMESEYNVASVGTFGYSMGGRIALEIIADGMYEFDSIEFIAPAEDSEDMKTFFGGPEKWEELNAVAYENGFITLPTIFGTYELSKEWFDDFTKYPDGLAEAAAAKFGDKPAIVIYSPEDEVISPVISQGVADVFNTPVFNTHADGHSYGFFNDAPEVAEYIRNISIAFFSGSPEDAAP